MMVENAVEVAKRRFNFIRRASVAASRTGGAGSMTTSDEGSHFTLGAGEQTAVCCSETVSVPSVEEERLYEGAPQSGLKSSAGRRCHVPLDRYM